MTIELQFNTEEYTKDSNYRIFKVLNSAIPRDVVAEAVADMMYEPSISGTISSSETRTIRKSKSRVYHDYNADKWTVYSNNYEKPDNVSIEQLCVIYNSSFDWYSVFFGANIRFGVSTFRHRPENVVPSLVEKANEFERRVLNGELEELIRLNLGRKDSGNS